ncbi:MAG: PAS domain S-box protein, partial [bacterium]
MKADRKTTKPISRGKSKTQEVPPTHKAVTPKPHEKKTESKQAETALHSAEENYRSIFEQAPVGIFQSTPQGRFRNVNSAMAQIYGYDSPEQMITEITSISDQVYVNSSTRQEFQRVLAERGEIHNSLDEHYRKDGSHIWTQTTARAIKDKDGKVLFYEGFIIDVTERLQEQQQLHESEERFRALIENASDMILTITADGNLNYVSPAALRITGYQADEVIGRNIVEFIHADDLPLALQALASRSKISGLAPDPIELRFHHKDGMWRIVEILGNNLLEYPAVKGIVLNVRDITDRKQAEATVRESEDRYRDLVENSQDLICTHDLNGQILSANPRAEKMLGYEHTALLQMNFRDILAPEARPGLTAYLRRITKRGADQGQMIVQTKTGERRIWEYNNTLRTEGVSTPIVRGMARDITERKQAEQEIDRLARFPSENPNPVLRLSRDGIVMYANAASGALLAMWGCAVGGSAPQFWRDLAAQLLVSRENKTVEVELDGKVYSMFVTPVAEPGYVNLYGRDITERRRAEEALRKSEERFRALIQYSQDAITLLAADGTVLYDSPSISRVLGYDPAERLGRSVFEFVDPEERRNMAHGFARFAQQVGAVAPSEVRFLHKDGTLRQIEGVRTNLLHEPAVRAVVVNYRDITERKQAEETLRLRASYLAAIIENQPGLVWLKDADCRFLTVNQAFSDSCGKASPAELMGKTDFDIWPKELAEKYRGDDVRVMKNKISTMVEEPIADRGETKWFETFKTPVLDDRGQVIGTTGYSRDITERKRAEEDLRASQLIIEGIINAIPMRVFWKDKNLVYLGCNAAFAHDAGFTDSKDVIGKDDYQMGWRDQAELYRGDDRQVIESGSSKLNVEEPQTTPEGNIITLLTSKVPLRNSKGETIGVLGMYMDITERKRAEEAVRDSEKHFRALIENSSDAITLLDAKGIAIYDSPASPGMLGYAPEDWIGRDVFALIHPDDLPKSRDLFQHLGETPGDRVTLTFRVRHKSGSWLWIEMVATNLLAEPSVQAIVLNYRDITDRKQAEETLQETQAHLRAVLNNVPITIFATDSHGVFTLSEGKGLEHVGLKPSENVGTSALDLYGSLPFVERAGKATTGMDVIRRVLAGETVTAFNELRGVYFENHISPLLG